MPVAFHSDATGIFFKPSGISGSISFINYMEPVFTSTGISVRKHR